LPKRSASREAAQKLRVDDADINRLVEVGAVPLQITFDHVRGVERLPDHHRDPFDRLLISQALVEGATIITGDPLIASYDVPVIWWQAARRRWSAVPWVAASPEHQGDLIRG
jgi:hypothetical protein